MLLFPLTLQSAFTAKSSPLSSPHAAPFDESETVQQAKAAENEAREQAVRAREQADQAEEKVRELAAKLHLREAEFEDATAELVEQQQAVEQELAEEKEIAVRSQLC